MPSRHSSWSAFIVDRGPMSGKGTNPPGPLPSLFGDDDRLSLPTNHPRAGGYSDSRVAPIVDRYCLSSGSVASGRGWNIVGTWGNGKGPTSAVYYFLHPAFLAKSSCSLFTSNIPSRRWRLLSSIVAEAQSLSDSDVMYASGNLRWGYSTPPTTMDWHGQGLNREAPLFGDLSRL